MDGPVMPEQIEEVRKRCTPKVNIAVNAVDNGYMVQGEVQWMDGDVVAMSERRSAVALDGYEAGMLATCFLTDRSFDRRNLLRKQYPYTVSMERLDGGDKDVGNFVRTPPEPTA